MLGLGLRDASGNCADACLGDQLDRDIGLWIDALEVVDQLGEIFNRVDVVVRGRANQAHARRRVANLRDVVVDLMPRQLSTLAGLRTLGHLDLDLVGIDEVRRRHTKAARRDLLDCRASQIAVGVGGGAHRILATFARVGTAAQTVHGDCQRLVCLA